MPVRVASPFDSPSSLRSVVGAAAFISGVVLAREGRTAIVSVLVPLLALGLLLGARGPAQARMRVARLLPPLLSGIAVVLVHAAGEGTPALLASWKERGFEAWTTPVEVRGHLLESQIVASDRAALVVRLERFRLPGPRPLEGSPRRAPRVRLTLPVSPGAEPSWRPGDCLDLTARLGPPRNFRNPGAFDYAASLKTRGITLAGTIKSPLQVRDVPEARRPLLDSLPRFRRRVVSRLYRAAGPGGEPTAAFLAALLVGERDDLPEDLADALKGAGVYHIVALSGFNVGIILLLCGALLRPASPGPRARRVLLMLAVALYWGIARGGGSISRAALTAVLYLAGGLFERRVAPLGALAITAAGLVAWNPDWVVDAGFQLTFTATLGLLVSAPRPPAAPGRHPSVPRAIARWALSSLRLSCGALLATSSVTAHHFHTLTPAALIGNLLAVPIASVLLVLALGVVLIGPFVSFAAAALSALAAGLIAVLAAASRLLAAPEILSFHVLPPGPAVAVWTCAAVVLAGAAVAARMRRACLALALLSLAAVAGAGRRPEPPWTLEITPLDVGQGDATLVRFPDGLTMLVDAGGFLRSDFDVGARVVAPALRSLGRLEIDILAITHAHRDHLGGAAAIVRAFSPGAVWFGRTPAGDPAVGAIERLAATRGIPVLFPRRSVRLRAGGALIEVLNPAAGRDAGGSAPQSRNDDSLVLRITYGRRAALLTGDLEAPVEDELVREGKPLAADLLKVGHHGSGTSTTRPFLARVAPAMAVISVGAANPWGHPSGVVIDRLRGAGALVFRTDRDGAVRFTTDGEAPWAAQPLTPGPRGAPRGSEEPRAHRDDGQEEDQ